MNKSKVRATKNGKSTIKLSSSEKDNFKNHTDRHKVKKKSEGSLTADNESYHKKSHRMIEHKRTKQYFKAMNKASWIDDIPKELIVASTEDQTRTNLSMVKENSFNGLTKVVGMDCEFVGVGYRGEDNALARASIVNQFGHILLDDYVRPKEKVTDYRTSVSGIRPSDLRADGPARDFESVHADIAKILENRIVVGHALHNDFKVLLLSHPKKDIRDTSKYRPFKKLFSGGTPSLKKLTEVVLKVPVQQGEHDSVQDARAAMRLYTSVKRVWESQISKFSMHKKHFKKTKFVDPLAGFSVEHEANEATLDKPYLETVNLKPKKKTKRELFYERRLRAYAKQRQQKKQKKLARFAK